MTASVSAHARDRQLRLSWGLSLLARISGAILQIVSLPIAAKALGHSGFVLYAMAMATLGWLMMANVGVGPALALRMAYSSGAGDRMGMANLFKTALFITATIILVVCASFVLILCVAPGYAALFPVSAADTNAKAMLIIVTFFFILWSLLILVEQAQIAQQQRYQLELLSVIGALVAAIVVALVAHAHPNPWEVLLAVQGPITLARVANSVAFLRRNADLLMGAYNSVLARALLKNGISISIAGSLTNFLAHLFPILLFGATLPPKEAAGFVAVMNGIIIFASAFTIVNTPLAGAYPEARARGDIAWVQRRFLTAISLNAGFAMVVFAALAFAGNDLFHLWYGDSISPSSIMLFWAGLYFVLLAADVTLFGVICAFDRIGLASLFLSGRAVLTAGMMLVYRNELDGGSIFMLIAFATLIVSTIPQSIIAWRVFR